MANDRAGSPGTGARITRLGPRIVLAVDADLAAYLCTELTRLWPRVRLRRSDDGTPSDLRVVDREPVLPTRVPTLWLSGIDGSQDLVELAPGCWRTAMPTTPARLRRLLECCLETLLHGSGPNPGRAPAVSS